MKFKAQWNKNIYGKVKGKTITETFLSDENGFKDNDRTNIKALKVGDYYQEVTPLGVGLTLNRVL
jgi:hypothetical protein